MTNIGKLSFIVASLVCRSVGRTPNLIRKSNHCINPRSGSQFVNMFAPLTFGGAFFSKSSSQASSSGNGGDRQYEVNLSEDQWKDRLTAEQYRVLREKGTERAFAGEYTYNHEQGIYSCGACGAHLFSSETKFDSGSGWPSFYAALKEAGGESNVIEERDTTHGMVRTEVLCKKCGSHLGHVFDDGPQPSGQRFCINSASLNFKGKPKM